MFAVHFFNNKNNLLSQLLRNIPVVGEKLSIKGRKGTVLSVLNIDEKTIHVQVSLETVTKNKFMVDNSKKKKR